MRNLTFIGLLVLVACSGLERGAVHPPDAPADAEVARETGADAGGVLEDDGLEPAGEVALRDADSAEPSETSDAPDTPDPSVPPGAIHHLGWFGPGGVLGGNGLSGLGSLSGLRQAWQFGIQ